MILNLDIDWINHLNQYDPIWLTRGEYAIFNQIKEPTDYLYILSFGLSRRIIQISLYIKGIEQEWYTTLNGRGLDNSLIIQPVMCNSLERMLLKAL